MPLQAIFLLLLSGLAMISCTEIIEFEKGDSAAELVIVGTLTNSPISPNAIRVTYTERGDTIEVIRTADVSIIDEFGSIMPYVFNSATKRYEPSDRGFHGVPGISYFTEVSFDGNTYQSLEETMPQKEIQDSVFYDFAKRSLTSNQGVTIVQDVIEIFIAGTAEGTNEPVYLKWDVEEVFIFKEVFLTTFNFPFYSPGNCYVVKPYLSTAIPLFTNTEATQYQIKLVTEPIDGDFKGFHAFGIVQSSLTPEAYSYWQKLEKASNRVASIFETPPGPVQGNIFNIADDRDQPLGYFSTVKVDTVTVKTIEADLPIFLPGDPPPGCTNAIALQSQVPFNCFQCLINNGVPEACVDCTVLPGSTRVRPTYLE